VRGRGAQTLEIYLISSSNQEQIFLSGQLDLPNFQDADFFKAGDSSFTLLITTAMLSCLDHKVQFFFGWIWAFL
jgi:hypothetical protein